MGKKTLLKKVIALALALSILAPTNLMYAGAGEAGTDNPAEAEVTNVVTEGTNDPTTASTEATTEDSTEEPSVEPTDESSEEPTEESSEEETEEPTEETDPTEAPTGDTQETTAATDPSEEPTEPGEDTEPTEEPSEEETEPSEEETEPSEEPAEVELEPNTIVATMFANGDYDSEMAADELVKITVSGMLPVDAKIYAYPVEIELDIEGEEVLLAYDITIFDGNGSKWQPDETVEVIFSAPELLEVEEVNVYHINEEDGEVTEVTMQTFAALNVDGHTTETIEVVEPGTFEVETVAENLAVDQVNQTVTFEADGFSVWVVTKVDDTNTSAGAREIKSNATYIIGKDQSIVLYSNLISSSSTARHDWRFVNNNNNGITTNIATVAENDDNGKYAVITGLEPGTVKLQHRTASSDRNGNNGNYNNFETIYIQVVDGYGGFQPAKISGEKHAKQKDDTTDYDGIYEVEVRILSDPGKEYFHSETVVPADVIIAIDLSNSMDGANNGTNYWPTAKTAMEAMIDNLLKDNTTNNTVSIAGYGSIGGIDESVVEPKIGGPKAYHIYTSAPTSNATTAKSAFNYDHAWRMRGATEAAGEGSRIKQGATNSEAGFVAAREMIDIVREKNAREGLTGRQIVVIYVSDGKPTKYYDVSDDGTRTEKGHGNNYEAQGKTNTISYSKALGTGVTVFTVGIGLGSTGANADAVAMMRESASTYQTSEGATPEYFYTDTNMTNMLSRLSELGVKLAHTQINEIHHTEFTLVDPMSEYVDLLSSADEIRVQRAIPGGAMETVNPDDYNITITDPYGTGRKVITLHVTNYDDTGYTYYMRYDVQVKLDYCDEKWHKDQTSYGGVDGDGTNLPKLSNGDGVVLNGYTHVTSNRVRDPQEIKVPVGTRKRPTGAKLEMLKVGEDGLTPLRNVVFTLKRDNNPANDIVLNPTDNQGNTSASFPTNSYYTYEYELFETTGPAGNDWDWSATKALAKIRVVRSYSGTTITVLSYDNELVSMELSTSNRVTTVIFKVQNNKKIITHFDVNVLKVDQDGKPLPGVKFNLAIQTQGETELEWTLLPSGLPEGNFYTTDIDGKIGLLQLEAGFYRLTEEEGLPGYQKIAPIYFTVGEDGTVTLTDDAMDPAGVLNDAVELILANEEDSATLKVTNVAFFELPETGGIGTTMFTIIGIAVMAGAAVLMVTFLRKRRKAK